MICAMMETHEYKVMYDMEQTYWWFVGKQFLVKTILKKLCRGRPKDTRILDIGCGTGIILKLLAHFGTPYGIEYSSEAIQFSRNRGLSLIARCDANGPMPFKSNAFSVITCLDVLEHLDNDTFLLKEMLRMCKSGGHVIITVPALHILWSAHDVALDHKRRYTKKEMLSKMSHLNAQVIKCSYYNSVLFLPILAVRKIKTYLSDIKSAHSDFFMKLPAWLNRTLAMLFVCEIGCLNYWNLPFGVSLLLILKKPEAI